MPPGFPLVHVTACWPAQEILKVGKIATKYCKIFGADLVYFFILRPAYKGKFGTEPSHQISRFPFAFILSSDAVPTPRHVYPFDTGAAAAGAFSSQADRYVPLEDYALDNTYQSVSSFITWAFGSAMKYFEGRVRHNLQEEIETSESVVVSYYDIARMGIEGSNVHDTRASTVEVAADHNVSLMPSSLLLIYPKQFLEGNSTLIPILKKFKADGVKLKTYDWQPNRTPDEFQSDIMEICRRYFGSEGYI